MRGDGKVANGRAKRWCEKALCAIWQIKRESNLSSLRDSALKPNRSKTKFPYFFNNPKNTKIK